MTDKFNWKAKREKKAFLALADGAVFLSEKDYVAFIFHIRQI